MSRLSVQFRRVAFFIAFLLKTLKVLPTFRVYNLNMDIANQNTPLSFRSEYIPRFMVWAWRSLSDPQITVVAVTALIGVAFLGMIIPQQAPTMANAVWVSNLSPSIQPWGEWLMAWGIARLFYSMWFWLPAAILLLNSLLILADHVPFAWQRGKHHAPITWQHPLARRAEYFLPLPHNSQEFLAVLPQTLMAKGFFIYQPAEDLGSNTVTAGRYRGSWLGSFGLYFGIVVLILGLLMSRYTLNVSRLTLLPQEPMSNQLLGGQLKLTALDGQTCQINYTPATASVVNQTLTWQLYHPQFFQQTLTMLTSFEPVLTIETKDKADKTVKLIPKQEDLAPSERLHLPLVVNDPVHFQIPQAGLTVQVIQNQSGYNVQIIRRAESAPSINTTIQASEPFTVDGYVTTVSLNYKANMVAYRDSALLLYLIGIALIGCGIWFIWLRPPLQVWFFCETNGAESQLHGVAEKFGSTAEIIKFLETLLIKLTCP